MAGIIGVLRLGLVLIVVEAILYVVLTTYLRSLERERLEKAWDAANPGRNGDSPARRDFLDRRMAGFHRTLRARLVVLVMVLPVVAVVAIVYGVNYG